MKRAHTYRHTHKQVIPAKRAPKALKEKDNNQCQGHCAYLCSLYSAYPLGVGATFTLQAHESLCKNASLKMDRVQSVQLYIKDMGSIRVRG